VESSGTAVAENDLAGLVERTAAGDRDAFADLYDATCRRAYGLALRVTGQAATAEDVVQDAYLQVWRSAPEFARGRGSTTSWILTMVHRRAVDAVRAQSARERRERRAARLEPRWIGDVREDVERREVARSVAHCLDDLTDLQRESISLAYLDGLTYREVAERLGSPLPAVTSRIRGALRGLRNCLGGTV